MLTDIPELNAFHDSDTEAYLKGVRSGHNGGAQLQVNAGMKKGAAYTWITKAAAIIDDGENRILAHRYFGAESALASALYEDKLFTKRAWIASGVVTPNGRLVSSAADAIKFHQELDKPIVLKPRFSYASKGVTVQLEDEQEIRDAYRQARRYGKDVLAEEYLEIQTEYRCFVGDGKVYALVERLPPHVIGDGRSTIGELIKNRNVQRRNIPSTRNEPIKLAGRVEQYLTARGKSIETVLPAGEIQQLSHMRVLGEGGDLYGILDHAPDEIKNLSIEAARAIPGAHWAGLDLIETADGSVYIIEINSNAQMNGIAFPSYGQAVPIGEILLEERLEQARKARLLECDGDRSREGRLLRRGRHGTPLLPKRDRESVPLSKLFRQWLETQGYGITPVGHGVYTADRGQSNRWFSGCLTNNDLAVVEAAVNRQALVRHALKEAQVPLAEATLLKTGEELKRFISESPYPVAVTAHSGAWKGIRESTYRDADEAPIQKGRSTRFGYYAQPISDEAHVRILASDRQVFAILSQGGRAPRQLGQAARLARRAISAVPGLRWAAVDIRLTRGKRGSWRPSVEGMTLEPSIRPEDRVLNGDITAFYSYLLQS